MHQDDTNFKHNVEFEKEGHNDAPYPAVSGLEKNENSFELAALHSFKNALLGKPDLLAGTDHQALEKLRVSDPEGDKIAFETHQKIPLTSAINLQKLAPAAAGTVPSREQERVSPHMAEFAAYTLNIAPAVENIPDSEKITVHVMLRQTEAATLMAEPVPGVIFTGDPELGNVAITGNALLVRQVLSSLMMTPLNNQSNLGIMLSVKTEDSVYSKSLLVPMHPVHNSTIISDFKTMHSSSGISFFAQTDRGPFGIESSSNEKLQAFVARETNSFDSESKIFPTLPAASPVPGPSINNTANIPIAVAPSPNQPASSPPAAPVETPPQIIPIVSPVNSGGGGAVVVIAPTVHTLLADQGATEDSAFSWAVPAASFQHSGNLALTYTATLAGGAALPAWLTFDAGTQTFTGTPLNANVGALSITVTATASNGTTVSDTFDMDVANTNDAPTNITATATSIAENSAVGTVIATLAAVDEDTGDTFTYAIAPGGDPDGKFAVAGNQLKVNGALNYETATSHSATVRVTDAGGLSYDKTFSIGVTNVNEPVGTVSDSNAGANTVAENAAVGTVVGVTATASDPEGAGVTWSLSDNAGGKFAINSTTGVVTVAGLLNYEAATSHTITVDASDGTNHTTQNFTIGVTNVNEAPTDITISSPAVNENSAVGTVIGTLGGVDQDAGASFTYQIVSDPNNKFSLSGNQLLVNGILNYESSPSHDVQIKVTDNTGLTYTKTLSIGVTNINDAPIVSNQTFNINENSANGSEVTRTNGTTPLHNISGFDEDGNSLSYSIVSGNTAGAFAVDSSTGHITVANAAALNYEAATSFTLEVLANDGTTTATGFITININNVNEAPSAITDGNAGANTVAENATNGAAVGITAAATDPEGTAVSYSLTNSAGGIFTINSATGVVTVANATLLNYESSASHTITVDASDGTNHTSQNFTIGVTDANDAPVISAQSFSINENSANGSSVGTVVAMDQDSGQTISYAITAGNSDGMFAINASTGALTIASNTNLNYELAASRSLTVAATDNDTGNLSSSATVTVNLGNVNEAPVIANQSMSVGDNATSTVGTVVGTVTAVDPDSGQTLTYNITSGNGVGAFSINSATGQITVADATTLTPSATFALGVQVVDNGTGSLSSSATVNVNVDNTPDAPIAADAVFNINENSANGTSIGTVVATDADGNALTYTITAGNGAGIFAINNTTGVISVANGTLLNYEVATSHALTVTVTDNSPQTLTDTAAITINVNNLNEVPVLNDKTVSLAENSANSTAVTSMAATDPDSGQTLTYAITAGNGAGAFTVNSTTGAVSVANGSLLNYEGGTIQYQITVQATDNGTGTLSDTGVLTINITNVNEAPAGSAATAAFTTNEDTPIAITGLSVADVDSATLNYTISALNGTLTLLTNVSGGVTAGQVTNNNTAAVTVTGATIAALNATLAAAGGLTYTSVLNYNGADTVTAAVSDGTLSDSDTVTITNTAVNDAPVVSGSMLVQSIESNATWSYTVPGGTFTDPDGDSLTYSVQYSADSGLTWTNGTPAFMTFNAGTRVFAVAAPPGNPNVDNYLLRITANDGLGTTVSSDLVFNITATGLSFDSSDPVARTIMGTTVADIISGGANNDTITAGGGNDTIYGNAGNDSINADVLSGSSSYTSDLVYGGDGNDTIIGENTDANGYATIDTLYGGNGDDLIYGRAGFDGMYGEAGNDTLWGGFENDSLYGGDGADSLYGEYENDILDGGDGNDTLTGGDGSDTLNGGAGFDQFNYIALTQSPDILTYDTITDFEVGIDKLRIPIFNAIVEGVGLASARTLEWYQTGSGGTAKTIIKSDGITFPFYLELTGHKNLTISDFSFWGSVGTNAADTINGTAGDDAILALDGNDSINAGAGTNQVWGGNGNDTIIAGIGNDVLYGEDGDDNLQGNYGANTLIGGNGNDTLTGYYHADSSQYISYLTGGAGSDYFRYDRIYQTITGSPATISAQITDFVIGEDKIWLDNLQFNDFYIGAVDYTKPLSFYGVYDAVNDLSVIRAQYGDYSRPMAIVLQGNYLTNANPALNLSLSDFVFTNFTDGDVRDTDIRANYIAGGAGADGIIGTNNSDTIYAGPGGDNIFTGNGNDLVIVKPDANATTITTGNGANRIFVIAKSGGSTVNMADGSFNGLGSSIIGINSIYGLQFWNVSNNTSTGDHYFVGGSAGDQFYVNQGSDTILTMRGNDGNNKGGNGNDWMDEGEGDCNFLGGEAGNDTIIGGYGKETMAGAAGNDNFVFYDPTESRAAGPDLIQDLNAGDKIVLYGFTAIGAGATELTVTHYNTTQYGYLNQDFTDITASNAGIDFKLTLVGNKTLTIGTNLILNAGTVGTSGADTLSGTTSDEFIFGQLGNDVLSGNGGIDSIYGGDGNDSVSGNAGNDSLFGGTGSDTMIGGAGQDTLQGDSGVDIFRFTATDSPTSASDLIFDFKAGNDADKIDLSDASLDAIAPGGSLDFSDLIIETPEALGGLFTRITISGTTFSVNLLGFFESGTGIVATDFIF